MSRSTQIACILLAFSMTTATAFEKSTEKPPTAQTLSISFSRDTAVVHASSQTEAKLIQAMITTLQGIGVKRFALRSNDAGIVSPEANASITITVVDNEARILIPHNVPYDYVVSAISLLAEYGVRKVKLVSARKKNDRVSRSKQASEPAGAIEP